VSTRRKILVVTGIYPPDIGGPATYIPQLCAQLHKSGHKVKLVSLTDSLDVERIYEPWDRTFVSRGLWKPIRILKTILVLFKNSLSSDVIFANGLFEEVAIVSIFHKKKRIVAKIVGDPVWERYKNRTDHRVEIEAFNQSVLQRPYSVQRKLLKWSLNQFSEITCPSEQLKELISKWGVTKRITVIKNGIECHEIVRLEPEYDLVTVSRLVKWKNLDRLILALANRNYSMAICGEGPERSNLEKLALEKRVKVDFLGQVTGVSLNRVINKSKVFALLSTYEGLSFALLEAMMSGKRILTSNARGNTDVIRNNENGIVVDPMNLDEISNALDVLIKNETAGEKVSRAAHQNAVEFYCAERQINKMIEFLDT
jgi:glycosyltransferase involved in cell wall biosynthesis